MPKMLMSKMKIIIFVQMPRQTKLNEECGSAYNKFTLGIILRVNGIYSVIFIRIS